MKRQIYILAIFSLLVSLISSCQKEERKLNKFAGGWTITEYKVVEYFDGQLQFDSTYENVGYLTLYDNTDADDLGNYTEMRMNLDYYGYFRRALYEKPADNYAENEGLWTADSPENDRIAFLFVRSTEEMNYVGTVERLKNKSLDFSITGNKLRGSQLNYRVETYKLERTSF